MDGGYHVPMYRRGLAVSVGSTGPAQSGGNRLRSAMNGHSYATKLEFQGTAVPLRESLSIGFREGAVRHHAEVGKLEAFLLVKSYFTSRLVVDAGILG